MSKPDLIKLFDLDSPSPVQPGEGDLIAESDAQATTPAEPTAIRLDDWGRRQGAELAAESELLKPHGLTDCEAADCFGAAFEPDPVLNERCESATRGEFFRQLLDTAEYRELHARTQLDPVASEIAASSFAGSFVALKKECEESGPGDGPPAEMKTLGAVAKAIGGAKKDVSEYQEAAAALGLGGDGGGNGKLDAPRLAAAFKRVRGSQRLQSIAQLAGRFRRVAQSRQRLKTDHGIDDVVGVVLDGDPGRLLPVELGRLADDDADLELDALRRIAERQAQCREWHASEPAGKGPIVVCVDESGSMSGLPIETAKALALALCWIARQQRRWVGLVGFAGGTEGNILVLPPGKADEIGLMGWLEHFYSGGTTLDVPLRELPAMWERMGAPRGKTDVLIVTDAIVHCPAELADGFRAWKQQAKARVISMVIGGAEPGDLAMVSDEVHKVAVIDVSSEEVGAVLSI